MASEYILESPNAKLSDLKAAIEKNNGPRIDLQQLLGGTGMNQEMKDDFMFTSDCAVRLLVKEETEGMKRKRKCAERKQTLCQCVHSEVFV